MLTNISAPVLPFDAIVFDCDGTLSHIEGIDELARLNNVGDAVAKLTADAMGKSGLNPELYKQRLDLVLPTIAQIKQLSDRYVEHKSPDLLSVLQAFHILGKPVYIISAGVRQAVVPFGAQLNIPADHIFAVDVYFNSEGNYVDFDHQSPLIYNDGKRQIITQLKQQYEKLVFIGDGLNDFAIRDLVSRFIGYGGAFYRKNIAEQCEFYLTAPSLMPLLDLCLTKKELQLQNTLP